MTVHSQITSPADLKRLPLSMLGMLAQEILEFLIAKVSAAGGHLGSNLGVVGLTIAVHRVFNSPCDVLLFDTGHQAYVHKILIGRSAEFSSLRQAGGLSGYPSRTESVHDVIENSHASPALSYADGLAKAFAVQGITHRRVVAIVGDGALTGGMCWEALNNLGAASGRPLIIVLNDNGRSYSPTVGGVARHLATLRQNMTNHHTVFEDLGLAYVGPVDSHDITKVEDALRHACGLHRLVVVHCVTRKGMGYPPAEPDETDHLHTVGVIDPATGQPRSPGKPTWTSVFAEEITAIGAQRGDVVCGTATMLHPTGLGQFAARFPDRIFDVGIAKQHAVTSAAGLAIGGLHPVVALYSTFVSRAFDQLLTDVTLHQLPVTMVLDRASVTGPDGPSHHGMWDASILPVMPGLRIAAPRDCTGLRELLREAISISDGPTVIRYPKATLDPDIPGFLPHATRDQTLQTHGLDEIGIATAVLKRLASTHRNKVQNKVTGQGDPMTAVSLGMPQAPVPQRRVSRQVMVGSVAVGGGAPVSLQSMTTTLTFNINATLQQIAELTAAGCQIVRVAVPSQDDADALAAIAAKSQIPVIADIHFQPCYVFAAIDAVCAAIRVNPGNIKKFNDKVAQITRAARDANVPIRIGVNAGSLDPRLLAKYGRASPEALVESALWKRSLFKEHDFRDIKISVKHHDPLIMITAYRQLAARCDYPLHPGVTEAGPLFQGTIKSVVAFRVLLAEGIGDTIRVSLSAPPVEEVKVWQPDPGISSACDLDALEIVSCPLVRASPGRRLHPRQPSHRRLRRLSRPATHRRHGLRGQRPRRNPRSRPRRLLRQRQRPDLRPRQSRQNRTRTPNRPSPPRRSIPTRLDRSTTRKIRTMSYCEWNQEAPPCMFR
jgi:1-deoxy-D-xylulose-5-phosphate synthase